jgi:hypothetical protein
VNVDELVRDSLREQAAEQQPVGPGLADRVLSARRHRRVRTLTSVAAATAAVVAVAIGVPQLVSGGDGAPSQRSGREAAPPARFSEFHVAIPDSGKDDVPLASKANRSDVIAHPDQSPPRDLIAAGDTALAAYYMTHTAKETADKGVSERTYWILDQRTGTYVKDLRWSYVDVAPGMRTAAVLEHRLPAKRIGLLDLYTGKVTGWIPADRGVAGVSFSPDGSKLVATTYRAHPDTMERAPNDADGDGKKDDWFPKWFGASDRTGFYILDLSSGAGSWAPVKPTGDRLSFRQDFDFSTDGKLVFSALVSTTREQFYDFKGHKVAAPPKEKYLNSSVKARLSPDGSLVAGDFAGVGVTTASAILDPLTGKRLHTIPGQQLLAWAGNKRLVAWDIAPNDMEFHNHLVLVTIGDKKTIPLSGFRHGNDSSPGRWEALFADR